MKRKICIVTGSRADYGLLRWIMQAVKDDPGLTLQVIATGMHLSATFGETYKEIERDGFQIDYKVEMLSALDTHTDILESMAQGLIDCSKAFDELRPDIVVVLGDRFEIFAAAISAHVAKIPIAHIHGGESTVGAIDEAFRHSISKMSQLHFVAAEEYRKRVVQLGENPRNVYLVGGMGVESISKIELLERAQLEEVLNIKFMQKSLLVTFHPVTLEIETTEIQMKELLNALSSLSDTTLIFTMPNADTDGRVIIELIQEFVSRNQNAFSFISLGQQGYFSCIEHVDGVIGNSSSGLTEVPSFRKGTINIGSRQLGRLQATSVINCDSEKGQITAAIKKLYSDDFKKSLESTTNPYGEGSASSKVIEVLKRTPLEGIIQKTFYDI